MGALLQLFDGLEPLLVDRERRSRLDAGRVPSGRKLPLQPLHLGIGFGAGARASVEDRERHRESPEQDVGALLPPPAHAHSEVGAGEGASQARLGLRLLDLGRKGAEVRTVLRGFARLGPPQRPEIAGHLDLFVGSQAEPGRDLGQGLVAGGLRLPQLGAGPGAGRPRHVRIEDGDVPGLVAPVGSMQDLLGGLGGRLGQAHLFLAVQRPQERRGDVPEETPKRIVGAGALTEHAGLGGLDPGAAPTQPQALAELQLPVRGIPPIGRPARPRRGEERRVIREERGSRVEAAARPPSPAVARKRRSAPAPAPGRGPGRGSAASQPETALPSLEPPTIERARRRQANSSRPPRENTTSAVHVGDRGSLAIG